MEVLDHLGSCTGFLYIIKSLRAEIADASHALVALSNTREKDICIKSAISTLKFVEEKYYDYVRDVSEELARLDEQDDDFEEEL